jgi:hypothetical protein
MHPTLLHPPTGPGGCRRTSSPRASQHLQPRPRAAVAYGGRAHHAELAYLTNFTPKLEAALALIPRAGTPQLLVGGGVNMLPAAKPLTWIEDIRALRNVGATVAAWAREGAGDGRPVLIGAWSMPHALHQELTNGLGGAIEDKTSDLAALMRRMSAHEIAAIRAACATLGAAMTAIGDAQRAGAGATAAVLAGEHAAHRRGAQDVRSLFSLDGGVSLRPFDTPSKRGRSAAGLCRGAAVRILGGRIAVLAVRRLPARWRPSCARPPCAGRQAMRWSRRSARPSDRSAASGRRPDRRQRHRACAEEPPLISVNADGSNPRRLQPAGGRLRASRLGHRVGDGCGHRRRHDVLWSSPGLCRDRARAGPLCRERRVRARRARELVELHLVDTVGACWAPTAGGHLLLRFRAGMRRADIGGSLALDLATRCAGA